MASGDIYSVIVFIIVVIELSYTHQMTAVESLTSNDDHLDENNDQKHPLFVINNAPEIIRACDHAQPENLNTARNLPKDCQEVLLLQADAASGQYMLAPEDGGDPIRVYCDMNTEDGGWTVFQRREDGSIDFYKGWDEYKHGFGNVNSEHWLGNSNIHRLTAQGLYELRIDMADFEGNVAYAKYDTFRVGSLDTKFKLILGGLSGGNAGDSLTQARNQPFSTKDRDNDSHDRNCATMFKAAWWFTACMDANLNGMYLTHENGIYWYTWGGNAISLKRVEMKMRMAP